MSKPVVEYNPGPSESEGPMTLGPCNSACVFEGGAYGAVDDDAMLMAVAIFEPDDGSKASVLIPDVGKA